MQSIAALEDVPASILDAIRAHAAATAPKECCGLVVSGALGLAYVPCTNTSNNGNDSFRIAPLEYADAEDQGDILLIVHSHPFAPPEPSEADLIMCGRGTIPWLIVNHPVGSAYLLRPAPYSPPLIGRAFHHGVTDCYTLIRDYYQQTLGIALPDYARDDDWWNHGQSLYLDNFEDAGFVRVDDQPQVHDVLLMQVRSQVPNHAAIYLGDQIILHHMYGRLSGRDVYGYAWQRSTVVTIRHKDLINANR